jgi:hypothetical protein
VPLVAGWCVRAQDGDDQHVVRWWWQRGGGGGVAVAAHLGVTRLCLGKRECGGAGPGSGHVRGSVP